MSVFKARTMLTNGWSLNGQWLVLRHDELGQRWMAEVHDAAGWLWTSLCPYTDPRDCDGARQFVLSVAARWSLVNSGVCDSKTYYFAHDIVEGRLANRRTPLMAARLCTARRDGRSVCMDQTSADLETGCTPRRVAFEPGPRPPACFRG